MKIYSLKYLEKIEKKNYLGEIKNFKNKMITF